MYELDAFIKTSGAVLHPRCKRAEQTQPVSVNEAFAQTMNEDAVQTSEASIQTTAKDDINMESQTSSEPPVACVVSEASMTSATEVSDMVSQAPAPTEVNEAFVQTADKYVTDKVSQTPALPNLSEASIQAADKHVTDTVSQTPAPPVVSGASTQTIHV